MRQYLRILCLVLVVLTVFAFTSCDMIKEIIPGVSDDNDDTSNCAHFYFEGVCRLCSYECAHDWRNGTCIKCDKLCMHPDTEHDQTCATCGWYRKPYSGDYYRINAEVPDSAFEFTSTEITPLNQMLSYILPYSKYMFRWETFDIYVNGNKVEREEGYTMIIHDSTSIKIALKPESIKVTVYIIENGASEETAYFLPKDGISVGMLGLLLFPEDGGLTKLFDYAEVIMNGKAVYDDKAMIDQDNSVVAFKVKDRPSGSTPSPSDKEYVGLRLIFKNTNGVYIDEWEFYVKNGSTFAELIENAFLIDYEAFDEMCLYFESDNSHEISKDHKITSLDKIAVIMNVDPPKLACAHSWNDGICNNCRLRCYHLMNDGECSVCGYEESTPNPESYSTATVSHKGQYIETYEYENGIMLSEFIEHYLGMDFDEFTVNRQYSIWVNEKKVTSDFSLNADTTIVYTDFTSSETFPGMCQEHTWEEGVCHMCGKECTHSFDMEVCEICGYYSEGIDNPIYVTYEGGEHTAPFSCTLYDFVTAYLGLNFDQTYQSGTWILNSEIGDIYPLESSKLSSFGRHMTLRYEAKEDLECYHNFKEGQCIYCSLPCEHSFKEGVCEICSLICKHIFYGQTCSICGYIDPGTTEEVTKYTYCISVVTSSDYVPTTITSHSPMTGRLMLKRIDIDDIYNYTIIVDNSIYYDAEKFLETTFNWSCEIMFVPNN